MIVAQPAGGHAGFFIARGRHIITYHDEGWWHQLPSLWRQLAGPMGNRFGASIKVEPAGASVRMLIFLRSSAADGKRRIHESGTK